MKLSHIVFSVMVIASMSATAQSLAKRYDFGGSETPLKMIATSDENLLLVGNTVSDGNTDAFITKIDTAGNVLWASVFGSPLGADKLNSVVELNNNYYATGQSFSYSADSTSDCLVMKYSQDGTLVWTKRFGEEGPAGAYLGESGLDIIVGQNNTLWVGGIWASTITNNLQDGYLFQISESGILLDEYIFSGGGGSEWFTDLSMDEDGVLYAVGANKIQNTWEPWVVGMNNQEVMFNTSYGLGANSTTGAKDVLVVGGRKYLLQTQNGEVVLCEFNSEGILLNVHTYGVPNETISITSMESTASGNILITSTYATNIGLVLEVDLSGNLVQSTAITDYPDSFYFGGVELAGKIYVFGKVNFDGLYDVVVIERPADGECASTPPPDISIGTMVLETNTYNEPIVAFTQIETIEDLDEEASVASCYLCLEEPIFSYEQAPSGLTFTFYNETPGNVNLNWTFGDGNGSVGDEVVYTFSQEGTYTVCLTTSDDCASDTTCIELMVEMPIGINELTGSPKNLVAIYDALGRRTVWRPNALLILLYDDGSTKKVLTGEGR